MGGMRKRVPLICFTMFIATLAITGIPPFAGFFSKDEILLTAFSSGEYFIWGVGIITAILTSYYMFRLFFVVFYGSNYKREREISSVPSSMKFPLVVLAIGSIFAGLIGVPELFGGDNLIGSWLSDWRYDFLLADHQTEIYLMVVNILAASIGILVAYKKFYTYNLEVIPKYSGIIWNKFYIDEIYDRFIVKKIKKLSLFISLKIDTNIIDYTIMSLSHGFIKTGHFVGKMQNSNTRFYAFSMLLGISIISTYLIIVMR